MNFSPPFLVKGEMLVVHRSAKVKSGDALPAKQS